MLINDTLRTSDDAKAIDQLVGSPLPIFKRLVSGGTGSKRMIVESFSSGLLAAKSSVSDIQYANIELRDRGIIVRISKRREMYSWVIPFHHLAIYSSRQFSIHGAGNFIKCNKATALRDNRKFIQKLLRLQEESRSMTFEPNK